MHEHSLIQNLVDKINQVVVLHNQYPVAVRVQLGALAHISASHFREHFEHQTAGSPLQNVQLEIEEIEDIHHPQAQDIILKSLSFPCEDDD